MSELLILAQKHGHYPHPHPHPPSPYDPIPLSEKIVSHPSNMQWLYAMQVYYVFVQIKSVSILMLPSFWLSLLDTSQWLGHAQFLIAAVLPCSCFEASAYWMPWFVPFVLHPWLLVVSLLQVSMYMIND